MQNIRERRQHLHLLQHLLPARRADDQQPAAFRGILLEQHQQSLKRQVGVAWPDGAVVEQPLDVVDKDARHHRPVRIVEDFPEVDVTKLF